MSIIVHLGHFQVGRYRNRSLKEALALPVVSASARHPHRGLGV